MCVSACLSTIVMCVILYVCGFKFVRVRVCLPLPLPHSPIPPPPPIVLLIFFKVFDIVIVLSVVV